LQYRGVIFPGGFSYADTLGSAKGWAASIRFNELLKSQFENFKNRKDTFSLGVCNGCQLMSMIGWIDPIEENDSSNNKVQSIALLHNKSGRFECRWSSLKIATSNAIMLRRMQGSVLGCWVAHGEGRFSFKNESVLKTLKTSNSIALHYVDDDNNPTEKYPMNPNGSIDGIAAICSADGRHLAMMPHPERCCEMFQWPYLPSNLSTQQHCPWQAMFDEANVWCCENKNI
jgi:phosphoribosylformylglycinamidine synthase